MVVIAGNAGVETSRPFNNCTGVFSVAASTQDDDMASFSNFGTWVELSAPGVDVLSTAVVGAPDCGSSTSSRYAFCSGTSMAAPLVTGVAALMYVVGSGRSGAITYLRRHADGMSCFRGSGKCGAGRLNSGKAVQAWKFRTAATIASTPDAGYWLFDTGGATATFGDAGFFGNKTSGSKPVTGAYNHGSTGYWMVASDGGIFTLGSAGFYGSVPGCCPQSMTTKVDMSPTPSGEGYWVAGQDGGVFTFGDAQFEGSGAGNLTNPVTGMAGNPRPQDASLTCLLVGDHGYWLVTSDGGVFTYGCAAFFGSRAGASSTPVVALVPTATGKGYWLLGQDGGVFTFGDAPFHGSVPGCCPSSATKKVFLTPSPTGDGYWIVGEDGGVFSFGDASFFGNAI